jgi:DNA-binding response OmpR family regulator
MKANLLVVDDEPITRQSLTDILLLEGYNVNSVPNGEAAIDHVRLYPVDLIVLDLRMPGMGGMEVMRALSQLSQDTEIILLTAHGSMETAVDALRYRVHDYLLKPASPRQILESVERGLTRRAAKLEQRRNGIFEPTDIPPLVVRFADGTVVDNTRRIVERGTEIVQLTPAEGHLLKVFVENPGKVYSHRELVLLVQGYEVSQREAQEILRPLISRLRHKIEHFPVLYEHVISVRGTGYLFEPIAEGKNKKEL